ncbi:peptidase M15 [Mycolicibacterium agri]|uniref:Peptidase M15 n=1 Tax=Mycolicibacterium agri TaxID=36811 RepID=A0A2A7N6T8_MYCAG|nr:M15 family metallopeptidase [Mycolicibacterium agri]PEG39493.1 peptidase M15 [Mycolicibacterium agri]GFG48681.1 hypothetical protein MAGR_01220 [Mycolicibacterium agri]
MPLGRKTVAGIGLILLLGACSTSHATPAAPSTTDAAPTVGPFSIGGASTDTVGGYLPDGKTLSPFDVADPVIGRLDPALLAAVQNAARDAAADGIEMEINSGWRTEGFQQRLFDDAVRTYGSVAAAAEYVASPQTSRHVTGQAVDVGPPEADNWLIRNGSRFGLCQIYANEIWHFELAADHNGNCPPLKPNAAG